MTPEEHTLQTLLAAQVLTLAKAIAAEKRQGHTSAVSSDGYVAEAIALIARERAQIIARLVQSQAPHNPAG